MRSYLEFYSLKGILDLIKMQIFITYLLETKTKQNKLDNVFLKPLKSESSELLY